jgi:hypothetical protein
VQFSAIYPVFTVSNGLLVAQTIRIIVSSGSRPTIIAILLTGISVDLKAFVIVRSKLTYYAINETMAKWRAIKDFGNIIDSGDKGPFEFNKVIRCLCKCELLLRFGLSCKH